MFEYRKTEKFDIGAGFGEYEYDFFTITDKDDFWALINHYGAIYRRFDYFLDGYKTIKNNTRLSPVVQVKMKEHNANLCLTFLEEEFIKNVSIKPMIVNVQKLNGIYKTYCFDFYHFTTVSARDYLERGLVYARANLHNAAIRHFSHAIKLDSSFGAAFSYRGISYMNIHKFDNAINDLTQAIEIDSEESGFYLARGFAYKKAGDFDKAKADFTKALELNPDDKMAKECLEEIVNAGK